MASENEITVRKVRFEVPERIERLVIPDQPEESYVTIGMSLLLPYLEPYLIRTMHAAKQHVTDERLASDIDRFNGQEGQHYRQHARFNAAIVRDGVEVIAALEAELAAEYKRWTETRSLRFNLAYAEGFEAFTSALARYSLETRGTDRIRPDVKDLFLWHLVEELEHRTVAFDVYDHVVGGYFYRLAVGLYAQWHLHRFVVRVAAAFKESEDDAFRAKYREKEVERARMRPHLRNAVKKLLPKVLATYTPWYSPHRIPLPEEAKSLGEHYAKLAMT